MFCVARDDGRTAGDGMLEDSRFRGNDCGHGKKVVDARLRGHDERLVRGNQRPAFVVAPFAVEAEVFGGEAFFQKSGALEQTDGFDVGGLDVGLDAVEREFGECVMGELGEGDSHQAAAGEAGNAITA